MGQTIRVLSYAVNGGGVGHLNRLIGINRWLKRYAAHAEEPADAHGKRMQAAVEGGRVWMIGIPGRGDMAAVEALCAARGLALTDVSWRR